METGNDVIEKGEETATSHANGYNTRFAVMTKLCVRKDPVASYLHWELYVCSGLGLQAATSVINSKFELFALERRLSLFMSDFDMSNR